MAARSKVIGGVGLETFDGCCWSVCIHVAHLAFEDAEVVDAEPIAIIASKVDGDVALVDADIGVLAEVDAHLVPTVKDVVISAKRVDEVAFVCSGAGKQHFVLIIGPAKLPEGKRALHVNKRADEPVVGIVALVGIGRPAVCGGRVRAAEVIIISS